MSISFLAAKPIAPMPAPVASTSDEAASQPDVVTVTGAESDVTARTFQSIHTRIGDRVVATGNPLADDAVRERYAEEVEAEVDAGGPTEFDPGKYRTDEVAVGALHTAAAEVAETKVAVEVAQRGVEDGHKDLDANPPVSKGAVWGRRVFLAACWPVVFGAGMVINSESLVPMYADQEIETANEARQLINNAQPLTAENAPSNWGAPAPALVPPVASPSLPSPVAPQATSPNAPSLIASPIEQLRTSVAEMKEAREDTPNGRARARALHDAAMVMACFTLIPLYMALTGRRRTSVGELLELLLIELAFAVAWGIMRASAPTAPVAGTAPLSTWEMIIDQRNVIGFFLVEASIVGLWTIGCQFARNEIGDLARLLENRLAAAERMARRSDVLRIAEAHLEAANLKLQALYRSLDMREHDKELRARWAKAAKLGAGNAHDEAISRNQTQILGGKGAQFMPPSTLAGNTNGSNNT